MKVLIQNYSSAFSTEPLYFHTSFKNVNIDSYLWVDQNISAFDMFDSVQPDLFIASYSYLTEDILKYLSQNPSIKMALSLSGAEESSIEMIKETLLTQGITNVKFFTNDYFLESEGVYKIYPAYDVFLQPKEPDYHLPFSIIAREQTDVLLHHTCNQDVYHVISWADWSEEQQEWADIPTDIKLFSQIVKCYDEIVVINDYDLSSSQLFFQATIQANGFTVLNSDEQMDQKFKDVLSKLFKPEETNQSVAEVVKNQIMTSHTCFNRSSEILNIMGYEKESQDVLSLLSKVSHNEENRLVANSN